MTLSKADLEELRRAKQILENPGIAAKFASYVGSPIEAGMKLLPKRAQKAVHSATEKAIMAALNVAVKSLGEYDCKRNVSRVVDETYHDAPALTGKTWHSPKFIPTPWAKPEPGSVGALRMAFACRALHDT